MQKTQFGFRKNRGTSDAIHCIRRIQEYEEQEFNPYYYFNKKLDSQSIEGKRSNDWKLYLDYHKYYLNFMNETEAVSLFFVKKIVSRQCFDTN